MLPETRDRRPNRLIHEQSPYLLQHAYNPVDWRPWGPEAFAKAKQEDKPIFLSVGYSTCYWCHVMEQESFDNPEIAQLINASFVPIKVDREERPDLDAIYMAAVTALSGQGGWPMTVFLTPEGEPFWGGTYFPPEDRWGRPGMKTILPSVASAWKTQREQILQSGQEITQAIQATTRATDGVTAALSAGLLTDAADALARQYDHTHGGFGPAPKFPRSHAVSLLLRAWSRSREARLLEMVEGTLEAMARGGIHDQLGGGFHRYSTDERWLVPHFEKMLYDQALLARTYLEAYQATGKAQYAEAARDVFGYVLRDLRDPQGAFYSAEDAGEVGKEGECYVWTPQEIDETLGAEEAAFVRRVFDVTPAGNFEGRNILHLPERPEVVAKLFGLSEQEAVARLRSARERLLKARGLRRRPHRDDKILADWNGLMIGALAYGARVLEEPRYAQAASQAAAFILERMQAASPAAGGTSSPAMMVPARSRDGFVLHRYRGGEAAVPGFLDDYAFLAWGLLDLYEATFDPRWLAEAKRLTQEMVRLFWDEAGGGFFFSGAYNETLIARTKELYDGAVPSGNSVAALVLLRVGTVTMDQDLQRRAEGLFRAFSGPLAQAPSAFPQLLIALDGWLGPSQEIVIAGDPDAPATQAMLRAVSTRFLPRAVILLHPSGERGGAIEALAPFLKAQQPLDGQPTAYLCERYVCRLPTTDPTRFASLLDALR